MITLALIRHCKDDVHMCVLSIGNKDLSTIEYPVISIIYSEGLLNRGICSGIGLCETKRVDTSFFAPQYHAQG